MTSPRPCQLLIDPPATGPWNMAVDEALLEWSAEEGAACWRFYRWQEPTVSLGYFQTYDDRRQHGASGGCRAVRRLTGGGAIVHDVELTYSLVLPADHPLAVRRDLLYRAVHAGLIRVLADLGLGVTLCDGSPRDAGRQPWLCFLRRSPGDVLLGQAKIAGSAQRRRRSAVLQHGSLLLRRSAAAPELPGLEDLAGRPIADEPLVEAWLGEVRRSLGVAWQLGSLGEPQWQRAAALAESRYGSADWTENRRAGGATGDKPAKMGRL